MEDPSRQKVTLKGTLSVKKRRQNGPDQASICDKLGVRLGCGEGKY